MIQMVTSDLDETLLRADGTVSDANVAAIKAAAARGVIFVPNTGRSFTSIQPLLRTLGLADQPDQYVVSYNGAAVIENRDNQVVLTNEMPYAEALRTFDVLASVPDADVHIYTLDQLYIYRPRADDRAYLQTRGVTFHELADRADFAQFKTMKIMKVIAMHPDAQVQEALRQKIETTFDHQINCSLSSGIYVEVNHLGVDKGQATLALCRKLNIPIENVMGLGDNVNDLAMLKTVGLPVVVANGVPAVKAVAQYVTQNDYECGVAEALHRFVLD
ncbi:haloacid dehalogenase [Levilactobacillus zymae]|uniref:Haloacid dehalogenase n=1 Tax=Levilactobacillus zymae TaxID=267363 RepID=A0ABQ0WXI9_9LACO|nr:Cof-type HAD-IIB family hydrolase [Levilactobacillus zymae]KRL16318.1 HAD superfamily hydrolase [Levilactobacillus zymae DSM 19395]QFR61912.1 Cof-type HAD-IIB family hydrolase [Levilactobacillus zymae]GEO72595.1 haloacid dehalogenase [Levilactobacillus zymae]